MYDCAKPPNFSVELSSSDCFVQNNFLDVPLNVLNELVLGYNHNILEAVDAIVESNHRRRSMWRAPAKMNKYEVTFVYKYF